MSYKVKNTEVMEILKVGKTKFYRELRNNPRKINLIKKGLYFEKLDVMFKEEHSEKEEQKDANNK